MQRRKFLATVGSLTAASAVGVGSGAFNVVRADRNINVQTVGDESAYLQLKPTSQYAELNASDMLKVNIDRLGKNSNYVMNDVFRIGNTGDHNIIVDLSDDLDDISWDANFPKAYWSADALGTSQNVGGDGEFNSNRPVISPGGSVFVQFEFVGRNYETSGNREVPSIIGIYGEATNATANDGD